MKPARKDGPFSAFERTECAFSVQSAATLQTYMITNDRGDILIDLAVCLPWAPEPIRKQIALSGNSFMAFQPLNRDRDLGPEFGLVWVTASAEARRQSEERDELVRHITRHLAAEITSAIQSRDPQHGYSPEEWAKIHPQTLPKPS